MSKSERNSVNLTFNERQGMNGGHPRRASAPLGSSKAATSVGRFGMTWDQGQAVQSRAREEVANDPTRLMIERIVAKVTLETATCLNS